MSPRQLPVNSGRGAITSAVRPIVIARLEEARPVVLADAARRPAQQSSLFDSGRFGATVFDRPHEPQLETPTGVAVGAFEHDPTEGLPDCELGGAASRAFGERTQVMSRGVRSRRAMSRRGRADHTRAQFVGCGGGHDRIVADRGSPRQSHRSLFRPACRCTLERNRMPTLDPRPPA
jgi:hypothetical protein